jgi:hypothetical protein
VVLLDVVVDVDAADVAAGAIVVASRLVGAAAAVVSVVPVVAMAGALVGSWVGAVVATAGLVAVLLATDAPAMGVGVAASTTDGCNADGVCNVWYGATVGVSHGAELGVYGAPMTTPADMVTKAAVAMPALADNARPPNHEKRWRLAARIPPIRLMRVRPPTPGRAQWGHVFATRRHRA